jgi:hypothetical protein
MEVPMTSNAHPLPAAGHAPATWSIPTAPRTSPETAPARETRLLTPAALPPVDTDTAPAQTAQGWGGRLVANEGAHPPRPRTEALRFAAGLGLAATYGVAIGARTGGAALVVPALGTPAALLTVGAIGVPAFAIVLALMNAPIDGARLVGVTARAIATSGLVLAGLSPAALLFALTSSTQDAAAGTAALGLTVAGGLGLVKLLAGLQRAIASADSATRLLALLASLGFGLFAVALAARVWSSVLPALAQNGGAP